LNVGPTAFKGRWARKGSKMGRPLFFVEHLFFAIVATFLLAINLVTLEV